MDGGARNYLSRSHQSQRSSQFDDCRPFFAESLLEEIGSRLLNANQVDLATAVFHLNVEAFSSSATTHERLAEAYVKAGDVPRAVESYERALKLDPNNRGAREKLEKLRAGHPGPVK
jgi:Tfp pilus assembly protein PilF